MAGGKIRGITVEIGGDTTKLGKALENVNKNTRDLQSELKGVEALLKMDPGNVDLLAQRQEILTEAVEETTKKLEILKEAEEQVVKQFENGDIGADQFRDFQREIINTQNKLNGLDSKLNGTEEEIEDVGDAAAKSGDGFTIMGGALADLVSNAIQGAISAIGDLVGALFELSEATEEYRTMQAKLEGSADTFGYSAEFAKGKYEEFYNYLGDDQAATNAITNLMGLGVETELISKIADGAIGTWSAYGDSIPIEALTESITESAKVGQVTGNLADALNWGAMEGEKFGLKLKENIDFTELSAKQLKGLTDEQRKEYENRKAQYEAIEEYNQILTESTSAEDIFNLALQECSSTEERAKLIADALNGTYGESKKKYDELNGSVMDANAAELELKETQAQLGETMAPVNTALTNLKNQALQAIVPLVEKLASAFLDLLNWLKEHPTVMKILTAVVIALAVAFGVLAVALGIQALINGVTKAFALLNLTMLSNPIVLIVALIAALVAAFIYLWNTCDGFREFWINLWDKITTYCGKALDAVVKFFSELPGKIKAWFDRTIDNVVAWGKNLKDKATSAVKGMIDSAVNWCKQLPGKISSAISGAISKVATWGSNLKNKAVSAVSSMVSSVVSKAREIPGKIASAISGAVDRVRNWGSSLISTAGNAIRNMVSTIWNYVSQLPSKFVQIGQGIIQGIAQGIAGAVSGLYNTIKNALSGLVQKAKNALGINSPSKVFANTVGVAIPEGIAKGIDDNAGLAEDAVTNMTDDITDQALSLNGTTINRKLAATFTGSAVGATDGNSALLSKLDGIYERLNRLQIVLDTGTLVGETIDKIDAGLANKQILSARGV